MKHMHRWIRIRHAAGPLALLLGLAGASPCCADSTLQAAAATGGPVAASAQLDFRITVAPTLALSPLGPGMRIQGNSGVLTLQRGAGANVQLHPRRGVVDTSIGAAPWAPGDLVTIASP